MKGFKKGQSGNLKGKPKGTKSEKTVFWNTMKDWFINEGAERFQDELMSLKGQSYVIAYSNALEFFQPKLSRAQVEANTKTMNTIKVEFVSEGQSSVSEGLNE